MALMQRPVHPVFAQRIVVSVIDAAPVVSDVATRVVSISVRVNNAAPVTGDSVSSPRLISRTASSAAPATDAGAVLARFVPRTASDSAPAADSASRKLLLPRFAGDAAGAADQITSKVLLFRVASDHASVTDVVVRGTYSERTAVDSAPAADSMQTSRVLTRNASDTAPVGGDGAVASTTLRRITFESLLMFDQATRRVSAVRAVSDAAAVSDQLLSKRFYGRTSVSAVPPASDAVVRIKIAVVVLVDSAPAGDSVSSRTIAGRAVSDSAPASDTATRQLRAVRTGSSAAPVASDAVGAAVSLFAPFGPPRVVTFTVDRTRLSQQAGRNVATLGFSFDQPVTAWTLRTGANGPHSGVELASYAGVPVVSDSAQVGSDDLHHGDNPISVYGRSSTGRWTLVG